MGFTHLRSLVTCAVRRVLGRDDNLEYWKRRARQYGPRAVLNLGHSRDAYDDVTKLQERELFPYLRSQLTGTERLSLDFGCGPGRFTRQLADITGGAVIGVDPVMTLLKLAPKSELVSYKRLRGGVIPLVTATVDVIWCCLVLGGMMDKDLRMASTEFERVLRPDGLLFLVENTSNKTSGERWTFRSVSDYCSLFPTIGLSHLHDYSDLGERISVISGRKHTQDSGR